MSVIKPSSIRYRILLSRSMSLSNNDGDGSSILFGHAPSPVPLSRGEILVNGGGASTLRSYMANWVGAFFFSINVGIMASIDAIIPITMSMPLKAGLCLLSPIAVISAAVTARCLVRAAVLEADGAHLRVYPYGAFFKPGRPVRVPLKLISISEAQRSVTDTEVLYACIKGGLKGKVPSANLIFDKPFRECNFLPHLPGSGLAWTEKGLAGHSIPSPSTSVESEQRGGGGEGGIAAFRNYALLVWLLQGNVVIDTKRLLTNDWDLENMNTQLSGKGTVGIEARANATRASNATWKCVKDNSGRMYWYNELTWETSWYAPASMAL
jgi:hypothetical protein